MPDPTSPSASRRIRAARVLYGLAVVPAFFLLGGVPIPPHGREVVMLVLLSASLLMTLGMAIGLRRWYARLRPLAFVLGVYGILWCVGIGWLLATGGPAGPALLAAMLFAGSCMPMYVIAALLLWRVPPSAAVRGAE